MSLITYQYMIKGVLGRDFIYMKRSPPRKRGTMEGIRASGPAEAETESLPRVQRMAG
jgi:hypothetical protein